MNNDVFTLDDNNNAAIRTIGVKGIAESNSPSVFTEDENGNAAIRVTGGGGDAHNKGYFATPEALEEAYATAEAGDFAIVGSTDTVWVWDSDTNAWKDTDTKGQVTSVNNQTGAVTLTASDILPSQTGNNGKFLKTNGTTASWSDDIYAGETTLTHKFDENDTAWFIKIPAKSDTSKALLDIHFYVSEDNECFYPNNSYLVRMNFVGSANTQMGGIKYISAGDPMNGLLESYYYFGNDNDGGLAINITLSELPEGITEKYMKCVVKYTSEITGAESVSESDFWDLSPNWVAPLALMPNAPSSNMTSTLIGSGGSAYWADSCQPVPVYEDSPDKKYVIVQNGTVATVDPIQVETAPGIDGGQVGTTIQYVGTTSGNWVNGYFYQLQLLTRTTTSLTVTQTTGSGLTITADKTTYETNYGDTYSADFDLTYEEGEWLQDGIAQNISSMGISITGTPQDGDVLTVHYEGLEYYSWVRIDVQPSGLPSQTGQSGKFLTTDGTDASWATISALQNTATASDSLTIAGTAATQGGDCVNVGVGSSARYGGTAIGKDAYVQQSSVAVGAYATANVNSGTAVGASAEVNDYGVALGQGAKATGNTATAIGRDAKATAQCAVQIGPWTNSTSNTMFVGFSSANYQLLASDGTIPADRTSPITTISSATVTQALANNYIYNCTVDMTSIEITLPATPTANFCSQLNFTSGSTPTAFTSPVGMVWLGDDVSTTFVPVANKRYAIMVFFDGVSTRGIVQAA